MALEKQKAETEAIISSLKENESTTFDSKEEIKTLQKKITELTNDISSKSKEISKLKTECQLQEENNSILEHQKKENIELKEKLAFIENELKRTTEEKKLALDELLKQTVKTKRKIDSPVKNAPDTDAPDDDSVSHYIYILGILTMFFNANHPQ